MTSTDTDGMTPPPSTPIGFSAPTPKVPTSDLKFVAKWSYKARDDAELDMQQGDVVKLLSEKTKWGDDWWKGQINDRVGAFPRTYVVPFNS